MNIPSHHKPELRVLHVFSALGVGGAETWLMALLRYLSRHQDDLPVILKFDLCLTSGKIAIFDEEAALLGARLFYLPYKRTKLASFVRGFRQILSRGRYHAIHDHQDTTAGLHLFVGSGLLPPIRIAHFHNAFESYPTGFIRKSNFVAGRVLVKLLASHIAGTSHEVLEQYDVGASKPCRSIRNAVHCGFEVSNFFGDHDELHDELCREFNWPETVKIVLFVGRLEARKNPDFAIDVVRRCIDRDHEVRMLIAGDGVALPAKLRERVGLFGLDHEVRFIGNRSDVPRLMLGSNLFLFPSLAEGLGMVLAEAQASGLRILASDTTPRESVIIPEIVTFRSLSDGPEIWADECLSLMRQPRPDIAQCNAVLEGSAFSIEYSAQRLLGMYCPGNFGSFVKQVGT